MGRRVLADPLWLFPELAERVVLAHEHYFSGTHPPARRLSVKELGMIGDRYLAGWRVCRRFEYETVELNVLLDAETPFSAPRIGLTGTNRHLSWPHVEKDNLLCLRQSSDLIDHLSGEGLTAHLLAEAEQLIGECLRGSNNSDFITEFGNYWVNWCDSRGGSDARVLMLAQPCPPSRQVYVTEFSGFAVVTDSIESGKIWAKDRYPKKGVEEDQFEKAAFIWLENPLLPNDYPRNNAMVMAMAQKAGCDGFLMHLVPEKTGSFYVVFGFESGNGPALGALRLNEPQAPIGFKGKRIPLRSKGFRPIAMMNDSARRSYFVLAGKATPLTVQRIDRKWVFDRGGPGIDERMDKAGVCLIGCGSLGGQIAMFLVQSGVRHLTLIDPDTLSWDNIGRHLLGAEDVGKNKAQAIKSRLTQAFPGMLDIHVVPTTWQAVFRDSSSRKQFYNKELIVSTIGNWDAEAALNHAFNTMADFPPVIYGWIEPFGFAGHAVVVTGLGGCLACGFGSKGKFNFPVTVWENGAHLRRAPACGETYQPYGAADIAPIQAMISRLCVDVITGQVKNSEHRAWVGGLHCLGSAGGRLWDGATDYYGDLSAGYRQISKKWLISQECVFKHNKNNADF